MITDLDIYRFDLRGYLEIPQALTPGEVGELNACLDAIPPLSPGEWYGFDPIHLRMTRAKQAWHAIFSGWPDYPTGDPLRRPNVRRAWSIRKRRPADRRMWGKVQSYSQPSVVADDLRLWLY